MEIMFGAAKGLAFLHEEAQKPVIFRDFKTSNILLDSVIRINVASYDSFHQHNFSFILTLFYFSITMQNFLILGLLKMLQRDI